jgi:hypothetical protein
MYAKTAPAAPGWGKDGRGLVSSATYPLPMSPSPPSFYMAFLGAMVTGAKHHPGITATFGLLFFLAAITMMIEKVAGGDGAGDLEEALREVEAEEESARAAG